MLSPDERDLDEMLVTRHLEPRKPGETLRQAINRIIDFDVAVATDPATNPDIELARKARWAAQVKRFQEAISASGLMKRPFI